MTQAMATSEIERRLEKLPAFDWSDFSERALANQRLLDELAADKRAVRELVTSVAADPVRRKMCEQDEFRYKLVLWRGDTQGFRLRLHMWRSGFADCVHAHRFSYTARLLHGGYRHTLWGTEQELYPLGVEDRLEQHLPLDDPFVSEHIEIDRMYPTLVMDVERGQCYSQHHTVLSSTVTQADTVSLFIRGPAERDYSIQWHTDRNTIVWRSGVADMSAERRREIEMTPSDFDLVLERLEALDII